MGFRGQRVHLRYNGHLDENDLLNFISNKKEVKWHSIVHDMGADTDTHPHTHALFWFTKKLECSPAWFVFEGVEAHFNCIRDNEHWKRAALYHLEKEYVPLTNIDAEAMRGKGSIDWALATSLIGSKRSIDEAALDPECAPWVAKYYPWCVLVINQANRHVSLPTGWEPADGWQTMLDLMLSLIISGEASTNSREVVWGVDVVGGAGKTELSKYWMKKWPAEVFYFTGGKTDDLTCAYNGEKVVIFDLTKGVEPKYYPYTQVEMMKNGIFFSGKYHSTCKAFDAPVVIVWSNYFPLESKLSADRWNRICILSRTEYETPESWYDVNVVI